MDIDEEVIKKVAKTARLNLTDDEIKKFTPQLKETLDAFSLINEVDTDNTKMSMQPVELKNALREDSPKDSLPVDLALKNTKSKDNFVKGPKVI